MVESLKTFLKDNEKFFSSKLRKVFMMRMLLRLQVDPFHVLHAIKSRLFLRTKVSAEYIQLVSCWMQRPPSSCESSRQRLPEEDKRLLLHKQVADACRQGLWVCRLWQLLLTLNAVVLVTKLCFFFDTIRTRIQQWKVSIIAPITCHIPFFLVEPKWRAKRVEIDLLLRKGIFVESKTEFERDDLAQQSCPCSTVIHITVDFIGNNS